MITKYKLFETLNHRGSKSLDEREFDQIRKDNCKNWTKAKTSLYRGQIDLCPYVYTDPRGLKRSSIEKISAHVDAIDNLPSWSKYPTYSESVIGSSELHFYLSGYGKIYEIIPFDNIDIAVCSKEDIWESLGGHGDEDPIRMTQKLLDDLGIDKIEDLKKVGKIENYWCLTGTNITGETYYNFINDEWLNPIVNGFSIVKYTEGFEIPDHKQIWTNGPVLLIHRELA